MNLNKISIKAKWHSDSAGTYRLKLLQGEQFNPIYSALPTPKQPTHRKSSKPAQQPQTELFLSTS